MSLMRTYTSVMGGLNRSYLRLGHSVPSPEYWCVYCHLVAVYNNYRDSVREKVVTENLTI